MWPDDLGLLVDLLGHEVAVVALVDQERGGVRLDHRALHRVAGGIADLRALALDHDPIAVLEVADRVGEGRQRNGIGAEIHLALAVADRERRAAPRADQHVLLALEQERERERALELWQSRGHRIDRAETLLHFAGDEVGDDFGVGLALELEALLLELLRAARRSSR